MRLLNSIVVKFDKRIFYSVKNLFVVVLGITFFNISNVSAQCLQKSGEISGYVYVDTNFNGIIDNEDKSMQGVDVFAYDGQQVLKASAKTDADGHYILNGLSDGVKYRIEFAYDDRYFPVSGQKDVRFVEAPVCDENLLLHNPLQYKGAGPEVIQSMFLQGELNIFSYNDVILKYKPDFKSGDSYDGLIPKKDVGSVWGLAFSRTTQQLFTAAFIKQYVAMGPAGYGAIYASKRVGDKWQTEVFVDLLSKSIDLGTPVTMNQEDGDYGSQVGKTGLGALVLDDDERNIYVTNLHNNSIIKIPVDKSKHDQIKEIQVPDPGCTGGYMHAFALEFYHGKLYVGVTCGAEISHRESDNYAHVYEYDPEKNSFTLIFSTSYPKGYWHDDPSYDTQTQHWLTDIEFTREGNMVLVLNDRTGHRYWKQDHRRLEQQKGDIVLAWNDNGTWKLENNGRAGNLTGSGVNSGEGPGGGEFFFYDFWPQRPDRHPETVTGSALVIEGSQDVIVPVYDPEYDSYSGGVKRFNTSNGDLDGVFTIYKHKTYPEMGKAAAFGDLDALYDPMPLEIGDYVWFDEDKDGIQDPGEPGIANVQVSLYDDNCKKVGITFTDANGYYVFDQNNVDLDGDGKLESPGILEKYYVVIDDPRYANSTLTINNDKYYLTILNKGEGINQDKNDNDATEANGICSVIDGKPFIEVNTKSSGENFYHADFGFADIKIFDLALKKQLVTNDLVRYDEDVRFKITVYNQGTVEAHDIKIVDYINDGYQFIPNTGWTYDNASRKAYYTYKGTLKPGQNIDFYITLKVKAGYNLNQYVNYAEIASALDPDGNPGNDIDSTPDDDKDNDAGGMIDIANTGLIVPTDDMIDDDGTIDEDDHDPAMIHIMDLALQKLLKDNNRVYVEGDTVQFIFRVYNQGNVIVSSYDITDYLPPELDFDTTLNPGWVKNSDTTAVFSVNEELLPFETKDIIIQLVINRNVDIDAIYNYGEISHEVSNDYSVPKDFDSVPNQIRDDDPGAPATDNQINATPNSAIPDEDDQDFAKLTIYNFDLALTKTAVNHSAAIGEDVQFQIKVFNQGAITADSISIVDYIDEGFELNDTLWTLYPNDSKRASITLTKANGLLPPAGLLPGDSVIVPVTLHMKDTIAGIYFSKNYAEIKEAFDIAGNNLGIYDKDSYPDDIKDNDKQGTESQLDGNGTDDEDDHDWASVFTRASVIVDPCECLHNATDKDNGQFRVVIHVISQPGETWKIDSIINFYDINSPAPPAAPVLYPVGMVLTETPNTPFQGVSTYTLTGIQVDGVGYYVRFVNNHGDKRYINILNSDKACTYDDIEVAGARGTCLNALEDYVITNPDPSATYSWTLSGGGSFVGPNTGNSVTIQWGGASGQYSLNVSDNNNAACQAPAVVNVAVGQSTGALFYRDTVDVSVGMTCEVEVTPDMILTSRINPGTPFVVTLIDKDGNTLPSNIITSDYIGEYLTVRIVDQCSRQEAVSTIRASDNLSPVLQCRDTIIDCDVITGYAGPKVSDNCDSDPVITMLDEKIVDEDCNSSYTRTITRVYVAADKWGNVSEPCTQHIYLGRLDRKKLTYPPDFLAANNKALTCNAFETDDEGNPSPAVTGAPKYNGKDIFGTCATVCNIVAGYKDQVLKDCDCGKIIKRAWYVFDDCEPVNLNLIYVQTIEITDRIPPVPVLPQNILVTTSGYDCNAVVQLPALDITDNCSTQDEINVDVIYPGGVLHGSNGGTVTLTKGVHNIKYRIYDKCKNLSEVDLQVTVVDRTPPVAICQTYTTVSLPPSGIAAVPASSFNSGSYDDCGSIDLKVRRMGGTFADSIYFDCSDLDETGIMVEMLVTDGSGNSNSCMVNVNVQHKYPPVITCPANMEVECDFPYERDSLSKYFGTASAVDVCGVTLTEDTPVFNINDCGTGTIRRHFVATGRGGITRECYQNIVFKNSNPFSAGDITWPQSEVFTNVCGDDQLSPDRFGWPVLNEDQCDKVSLNYDDETFYGLQDEACYTVVRHWTVLDECQIDNGKFKRWYFEQVIHIINEVDPVIQPLEAHIDTCSYDDNCSEGDIRLEAHASDDCTAPDDLQWTYQIDLDNDGDYDIIKHQVGPVAVATGTYPIGTHRIIWQVEDACGNTDVRSQTFTIKNCTRPTAICIDAVVIELGKTGLKGDAAGEAKLLADAFNRGSYHVCGYPLQFSYSSDVNDTILYLDCSWVDEEVHDITLVVTDIFGNQDSCITHLKVQDNMYVCNPYGRCIHFPGDSVVIEECNPDLTPGNGLLDSLTVDTTCGCNDIDITYTDTGISDDDNTCLVIERQWSVDFNCEEADTTIYYTQKIVVKNTGVPELECPDDMVVVADDDNCSTYVNVPPPVYDDDGCSTGLSITNDSPYADQGGANASGTYPVGTTSVQFTLTNDCGVTSQCSVLITVNDETDPLCVPNDTVVALDANGVVVVTGEMVAGSSTDNCGIDEITVEPDTFTCSDIGDNTVNITVEDNNGNQANCTATVTVIDTLTQLCNAHDTTIYINENGYAVLDPQDIYAGSGGCGGSNDVSLVAEPDTFYCEDVGPNNVQLIVTDNVTGESDTCEATVTVLDTVAPQCLVHDETVYLDDNGTAGITFEDIDNGSYDPCGEIVDTLLSDDTFDCQDIDDVQNVIVTLTDNSGNTSNCTSQITVLDTVAPHCVPIDTLYLPLDSTGMAVITGQNVDAGSYDNCGTISLDVEPNTFYCNDVFADITYTLTVTDGSDNQSQCQGVIIVQDTIAPELICPADTTIACDQVPEEVDYAYVFGDPVVNDNCFQDGVLTNTNISNIDNCGSGLISRNFSYSDPGGNLASCTQLITVEAADDNFSENSITWPEDTLIVDDCFSLDPDTLDSQPVINYDDAPCSDITVDYEDTNLTPGGSSCNDTIQRVWTVVDSCLYDANNNDGIYRDTQIIIIDDTNAPLIYAPGDTVVVVQPADDQCGNAWVQLYGYIVDCDSDAEATNNSPYADNNESADASGYYPEGEWDILVTGKDHCDNYAEYTYHLTVQFPSYCVDTDAEIDSSGTATVYVDQVTANVPDCADMSFSPVNPALDSTVFDCDDAGAQHDVTVYKFDQNGILLDSCVSIVNVTDPDGYCNNGLVNGITGKIFTTAGYGVENVNITVYGLEDIKLNTAMDGSYKVENLNSNMEYRVVPYKNDDPLNGINTLDIIYLQRHLLGISKLKSPYKILAADVDRNKRITGSDILSLRKLILGYDRQFKNNTSWRFVEATYLFEDAQYPFNEEFPEEWTVSKPQGMENLDFIAVKTGDLDNSAIANSSQALRSRSDEALVLTTTDMFLNKDGVISVPVMVSDAAMFAGMQFTLHFDPEYLKYEGISGGYLDVNESNTGVKYTGRGKLTFSWNDTADREFKGGTRLFTLRFKVLASGVLSELLSVGDGITPAEAYTLHDGKTKNLKLRFATPESEEFVLYQNKPNPWSEVTAFNFRLPGDGIVNIKITNSTGMVIFKTSIRGTKGLNEFVLQSNTLDYRGLMFVDFEFEGKHIVKRMVRMK